MPNFTAKFQANVEMLILYARPFLAFFTQHFFTITVDQIEGLC